jgi:endo-1,4-beta-xylanase
MHHSHSKLTRPLIFTSLMFFILAGCASQPPAAATDPPLPPLPQGRSMLPADVLDSFSIYGTQKDLGKVSIVDVRGEKFQRAARVQTMPGSRGEYNVTLVAPVVGAVKTGDVLLAHFRIRCEDSMTGEAYTNFCFELNHDPFNKAAEFAISASKDWREVFVPFSSPRNFADGTARIAFWVGYDRQTIDIADVSVINFDSKVKLDDLPATKITYVGREANAPWRQEALKRIEKYRKGDIDVYVTDAQGNPLPGASIHAVLRQHAFGFGTCVDADLLLSNTPDAQRYKQTILSLFNRAVFENEMKWQATYNGVPAYVDKALAWLRTNGIEVRGHNLVWPGWQWLPPELWQYRNNEAKLREITAKHITYMVSHFRGQLIAWDVVNEPFTNHILIDLLGGRDIMVDWFNLAHQADPDCRLCINDFGILDGGMHSEHRDNFYGNIQFLLAKGAPLGGIGIQSHFGTELPAPADIIKILDRFSGFGLPIESTEVSINLRDRQLQADYLRDYMIALFSEPQVQDIILWGFWQKRHWRPEAGIYNDDWSPRPAALAFIDLTQKQWSTDVTTTANAQGESTIRGFFGSYDITVTSGGKTQAATAKIVPGGSRVVVRME